MATISKDIIDRVRETTDIVDIISEYVDLKQKGPNLFGLCPFHNEKTPSFSVAQQKQIYYCFGCHLGGNVFSFLMEYLKIPFPEAVKICADRCNIDLVIDENNEGSELFSALYKIHDVALELYQSNLFSPDGERALQYLKDRGLNEDIIRQFKIGYSLDNWVQLVEQCKGRGFTKSQILKSGLFTHSDKGMFDRFRSRIMFPFIHPSGKTIAFGGRIFESNDSAKYLNSPETPLYKKSNTFYGLQATRDAIRKEGYVILVEGYMDFIKLYQANILPVVSVSGTAFSSSHGAAIKKITNKVILLYDGDSAGVNAALRAGWVLLKSDLIPSVVQPPENLDPDDWVTKNGKDELMSYVNDPMTYVDFHIASHKGNELMGVERQDYIVNLSKEIKEIKDGFVRNDMIKILSQKLSIDEKDLIRSINTQRVNPVLKTKADVDDTKNVFELGRVEKAQIELLKLLLDDSVETRRYTFENISIGLFKTPILNKLAQIIIENNLEVEISSLTEYFQDKDERSYITKILFNKDKNSSYEEIVSDCLKILKSEPIKEKISSLRVIIREKESNGHDPTEELNKVNKLQLELNAL